MNFTDGGQVVLLNAHVYLFKFTAAQWDKQSKFEQCCGLKLMSIDGNT
ncbi:hypothetical protein [Vibrio cholerae]|nr:hypothetical protein [Vibrio cholerae]CPR23344.1 hypothetical protein [Vibrio cholerae]CPR23382.1 hypothetical protein [Vibrio cholerae]